MKETKIQLQLTEVLRKIGHSPEVGMGIKTDYGKSVEIDIINQDWAYGIEMFASYWRKTRKQKNWKQSRADKDMAKTLFLRRNYWDYYWIDEQEITKKIYSLDFIAKCIDFVAKHRFYTGDIENSLKGKFFVWSDQ